jgi:hypothetical protein
MTPDETARELADLRKRVQRLEDALEGLFLHRPRLVTGLRRHDAAVGHREALRGQAEGREEPGGGDAWPPGATFAGWR